MAALSAAITCDLSAELPFPVQQAYLKASNTDALDSFGYSVAVSGDTMVIGAVSEASKATGVDGSQKDQSAPQSGAAYVFVRAGTNWSQQAFLKASNTGIDDQFGESVSISGDTIVVGASHEASNATGVNGNGADNNAPDAGAAYVFVRTGTNWSQQAYLKASNPGANDSFGSKVALSGDLLLIGAPGESSNAPYSGAAYVFVRTGTNWSQQAYLKASNPGGNDQFGSAVAVSGDMAVVGAPSEDSNATGVNGDQDNDLGYDSGAAYVLVRSGTSWSQQAYLKASNTGSWGRPWFGYSVAVSGDTALVGAPVEESNAGTSGAAYLFVRSGSKWGQQAFLKASNIGMDDRFGSSVAISGDTAVIGAPSEASSATGVNGDQSDNTANQSGAAYVFSDLGLGIFPDGRGGYSTRFKAIVGTTYGLERAITVNGTWTNIASAAPIEFSNIVGFYDTNAPAGHAFYRTVRTAN